jgi:flagellar biosynthesis protein
VTHRNQPQRPRAAVALGYDPEKDPAPRVLAAGKGEIARQIEAIAREHAVPIHQDHPLAEALVRLETGSYIPPELYRAVAEVLAFLYQMEGRAASRKEDRA